MALLLGLPGPAGAVRIGLIEGVPVAPEATPPSAALAAAIEGLKQKDAAAALKAAREVVKSHPGSALAHEVHGAAALLGREFKEAEGALGQALKLDPRRASAMVRLGQLALETGDPKKAEQWLRKALDASSDIGPVARRILSVALMRQGRLQAALAEAQESVRLSGGQDAGAKYLLGAIYHEVGRPAEAEKALAEVVAADPGSASALVLLGLVKLELRKTDEAALLLERVVQRDPGSQWARLGLSLIQRSRGQLDQARGELEKLTRERPDWALAQFELGRTLLLQRQRDQALGAFERAEKQSPDPALVRVRAGHALLAVGEFDQAIEKGKAALGSPTAAPFARALLVQAYLATGKADLAEQELQAAASAAPQDPAPLMRLGRFYLAQRRPKEALAQFEQAEKVRPQVVEPLAAQAETHLALNQGSQAVRLAERVVKAQGETADAYLFLGAIQERSGRRADAATAYQKALEREAHHIGAARAR